MDGFGLREPFSALSHGAGFVLALVGAAVLLKRARGGPAQRLGLLVFGTSLAGCYAASAHYHASHGNPLEIAWFRRLDHVGIYGLIAGTYTPITANLLSGYLRRSVLLSIWFAALSGSLLAILWGALPGAISTSIYLALGWGGVVLYREISRRQPQRNLRPLFLGGAAYSMGAVLNLVGWPRLWPGVFGPHELFHIFVLVGSGFHYAFILSIISGRSLRPSRRLNGRLEAAHGPRPIATHLAGSGTGPRKSEPSAGKVAPRPPQRSRIKTNSS